MLPGKALIGKARYNQFQIRLRCGLAITLRRGKIPPPPYIPAPLLLRKRNFSSALTAGRLQNPEGLNSNLAGLQALPAESHPRAGIAARVAPLLAWHPAGRAHTPPARCSQGRGLLLVARCLPSSHWQKLPPLLQRRGRVFLVLRLAPGVPAAATLRPAPVRICWIC